MTLSKKLLVAAALAGGLATIGANSASAYIVCDRDGDDCWHSESRYRAPGVTFTWHNDDWYFHQKWDDRRHFRDYHEGRGYYRNGIWFSF